MINKGFFTIVAIFALGLLINTNAAHSESNPRDGELSFPSDYKNFPVFLKEIQKKNAVRDLYVNKKGSMTQKGQAFPNGTQLVMAIFSVKADANGTPSKGSDGKLVKDKLAKVYLMEKGSGWGANAPKDLKNGDWIFSAFSADGKPIKVDYSKCRNCHLPLGESKDFVHRYDEYFGKRGH